MYHYTEDYEEINVLVKLNEYADRNPQFKNKFLDSCDKIFTERGCLTDAQIETLDKIYDQILQETNQGNE